MQTLIIDKLSPYFDALLKERGLDKYFTEDTCLSQEAEIIIIKTFTTVDETFLRSYPGLKLIIRAGTGYDNIDLAAAKKRNIIVCNTPEANALSAAEHTVSLIFALLKQHQSSKENIRAGKWKEGLKTNWEIGELKALVVGVGRIGSRVARFLQEFGAEVQGVDPYLSPREWVERGIRSVDYKNGLRWCNLITFHTPFNRETTGYFSLKTLEMIEEPVWLINTARGGIVNEEALKQGLDSGKVLGAGLDVYSQEPDPELSFVGDKNVYLTPHTGAYTKKARIRMAEEIIHVWESYVLRKEVVNKIKEDV
jgi:D-3-phosphoglycerate dehydrogenase